MEKTLFTFFKLHQGGMGEDASMETATILADSLHEALEQCKKQFQPDSYHEIPPGVINKMQDAKPVILANNDDIKDLS